MNEYWPLNEIPPSVVLYLHTLIWAQGIEQYIPHIQSYPLSDLTPVSGPGVENKTEEVTFFVFHVLR